MKKSYFLSFLSLLVLQNCIAQSWITFGSDEQAKKNIVKSHEFTFFTKVSGSGVPYFTYEDNDTGYNNLNDFKIHAKRYINGRWELAGDAVSATGTINASASLTFNGDIPYAAYSELVDPGGKKSRLTVKRLNGTTDKWEAVGQPVISDSTTYGAVMAADGSKIYVAYLYIGGASSKITVMYYDTNTPANGWQQLGSQGLWSGIVSGLNITVDNGIPYVAYINFPQDDIIVQKFNGASWENVGSNSPEVTKGGLSLSLQFSSSHTAFISYIDVTGAGIIRTLNNTNTWVTLGSQAVAPDIISDGFSLVVLKDIPFLAYGVEDADSNTQVYVKKFSATGNTWADAGNQPVVANTSFYAGIRLSTDNNNMLYLLYRNFKDSGIYAKKMEASSLLPVTLTAFYATKQKGEAVLNWATANEAGFKLFDIEHSADGSTFIKIGEAAAKGNINAQQQYSFIHSSPAAGINYYRLKQVDKNGDYTYSKTISIMFGQVDQSLISIYPNPAKNILHIANLQEGAKRITVYNAEGKIVKKLNTSGPSADINIANLAAGTYFIKLQGDTLNETKVFVK